MKPPFIVLEGVEGSGKSTQARMLRDHLERRGVPHLVTREPGGSRVGEAIREIVLHGDDVTARTELLLMLAARATFVEQIVEPALAAGRVVIADRFEMSTLAYQAYGRGLPLEDVRRLNAFATGGLAPAVTIVLDVDPAAGAARRAAAGAAADRIERAGEGFHERVGVAYRLLASSERGAVRIDGTGAPDVVHASILRVLREAFPETFGREPG
jgi:dTMP kinase